MSEAANEETFKCESLMFRDSMRFIMRELLVCKTEETQPLLKSLLVLAESAKERLNSMLVSDRVAAEKAHIPGALCAAEKIIKRAKRELKDLSK